MRAGLDSYELPNDSLYGLVSKVEVLDSKGKMEEAVTAYRDTIGRDFKQDYQEVKQFVLEQLEEMEFANYPVSYASLKGKVDFIRSLKHQDDAVNKRVAPLLDAVNAVKAPT